MKAHTPGPWTYELLEEGHQIRMGTALADSGSYLVHHTIMYEHGLFPAYEDGEPVPQRQFDQFIEAEANARLIAAAPEMLEALKSGHGQAVTKDGLLADVANLLFRYADDQKAEVARKLSKAEILGLEHYAGMLLDKADAETAAIAKAEGGTDEEVE